jgi:hypothetical protein
MLIFW